VANGATITWSGKWEGVETAASPRAETRKTVLKIVESFRREKRGSALFSIKASGRMSKNGGEGLNHTGNRDPPAAKLEWHYGLISRRCQK